MTGTRLPRETRLLIVTITVSALVLLLLARLRFPEAPAMVTATAPPLERLAARATYEQLAENVARLERTIEPSLIVLRLAPRVDSAPRQLADLLARPDAFADAVRHVPALRLSATTALAAIDADTRVTGIVGAAASSGTASIVATDPVRRLSLVRVPEAPARVLPQRPLSELTTPSYVVAVEGTHAGVTLRPVFLGRGDRFSDARWPRPLLPLGGVAVTAGALMFSLEGQFLGCVILEDGTLAVASAEDVVSLVTLLAADRPRPTIDPGIGVQPLTPALAEATGVKSGVIVAEVRQDGAAAGVLEVGDAITALEGRPVDSPEALLIQLARRVPGGSVSLSITRGGEPYELSLPLVAAAKIDPADGMELRLEPGAGSVVTYVQPGSPPDAAGLRPGDLIVQAAGEYAPSPAQMRRILTRSTNPSIILIIRRDGRQRIVAVPTPQEADAAR